jgi:serine/threonine protein kinase
MENNAEDSTQKSQDGLQFLAGLPGRYQTRGILGQGGMGIVFHAFDGQLDRDVAIKVLTGNIEPDDRRRFLQEAKALAALDHVNIVKILSSGLADGGLPYHVMEFLEGESLLQELKRNGTMSAACFHETFLQVLAGLSHAHAQGLTHRDLKPSNLMLCRNSEGNRLIKIIDFGIARMAGAAGTDAKSLTRTNALLGSPPYMSPEQCRGEAVDHLSDIYSIACIMCECITGSPPFLGDSALEIMYRHLNDEPPRLESLAKDRSGRRLGALIDRCLSKDKVQRIQSMKELKQEIDEVFKSEVKSIGSFSRKKKFTVVLATVTAICLAAATAGIIKQMTAGNTDRRSRQILNSNQASQKSRHLAHFKHLQERIKLAIKNLNNGKSSAKKAKVDGMLQDSRRLGNEALALWRVCSDPESASVLAESDRVLTDVLCLEAATPAESILPLIKRAQCRLELGNLAGCRTDFNKAVSDADRNWGANSQQWLDVYLQYIPYLICSRQYAACDQALEKIRPHWQSKIENPKGFWASSQFLEPDGPHRLDMMKDILRQLEKTEETTGTTQKQRIRLFLELGALFREMAAQKEASKCLQLAARSIAGLPGSDAQKQELLKVLTDPEKAFGSAPAN